MKKRNHQIPALITLACFVLTQFGIPSQAASQPRPSGVEVSAAAPFKIDLPPALGTIETLVSGSGPSVIQIQEAHGNYEVQKKIREILEFLHERYGFDLVLLEGSAFKLHPELIRFYPRDLSATAAINESLARKMIITGPEIFLAQEKKAQGIGIEDLGLYTDNGRSFHDVLIARGQSQAFLDNMNLQIERLISPYLNQDLRRFLKKLEDYEAGLVPLHTWLSYLKVQAKSYLKLDLNNPVYQTDWPMMLRIFKLEEMESGIDTGLLKTEKAAFLSQARVLMPRDVYSQVEELLNLPLSENRLSDPDTGLLFEKMVSYLPRNFDYKRYPNLNRMIGHLILQSELKGEKIAAEINRVVERLTAQMARDEREVQIAGLLKDHRMIKRLFNLELTPGDYESLLARGESLNPQSLAARFIELNREGRVRDIRFGHLDQIERLFEKAVDFYRGAKERDQAMLRNIDSVLNNSKACRAVVITGGFHAKPFADHFNRQGFNYALISPKITTPDDQGREDYVQAILRNYRSPASAAASTYKDIPYGATAYDEKIAMARNPRIADEAVAGVIYAARAANRIAPEQINRELEAMPYFAAYRRPGEGRTQIRDVRPDLTQKNQIAAGDGYPDPARGEARSEHWFLEKQLAEDIFQKTDNELNGDREAVIDFDHRELYVMSADGDGVFAHLESSWGLDEKYQPLFERLTAHGIHSIHIRGSLLKSWRRPMSRKGMREFARLFENALTYEDYGSAYRLKPETGPQWVMWGAQVSGSPGIGIFVQTLDEARSGLRSSGPLDENAVPQRLRNPFYEEDSPPIRSEFRNADIRWFGKETGRAPKILVVDDEQPILDELTATFSKLGFKVVTARNSMAALEALADNKFHSPEDPIDVVVSNNWMPKRNDGVYFYEQYAALQYPMPFIFHTKEIDLVMGHVTGMPIAVKETDSGAASTKIVEFVLTSLMPARQQIHQLLWQLFAVKEDIFSEKIGERFDSNPKLYGRDRARVANLIRLLEDQAEVLTADDLALIANLIMSVEARDKDSQYWLDQMYDLFYEPSGKFYNRPVSLEPEGSEFASRPADVVMPAIQPGRPEARMWIPNAREQAVLDKVKLRIDTETGRIYRRDDFRPMALDADVWALRHGQTFNMKKSKETGDIRFQGQSDVEGVNDLDETGQKQAEGAAQKIMRIEAIQKLLASPEAGVLVLTSPLKRTQQTKKPLQQFVLAAYPTGHNEFLTDAGLREMNFGRWDNKTYAEIRADLGVQAERDAGIYRELNALVKDAEGENFIELLDRAYEFLLKINRLYPGRTIVLVGHGSFFSAMRVLLGDETLIASEGHIDWRQNMLPAAEPFHLNEIGARSEVRNDGGLIPAEVVRTFLPAESRMTVKAIIERLTDPQVHDQWHIRHYWLGLLKALIDRSSGDPDIADIIAVEFRRGLQAVSDRSYQGDLLNLSQVLGFLAPWLHAEIARTTLKTVVKIVWQGSDHFEEALSGLAKVTPDVAKQEWESMIQSLLQVGNGIGPRGVRVISALLPAMDARTLGNTYRRLCDKSAQADLGDGPKIDIYKIMIEIVRNRDFDVNIQNDFSNLVAEVEKTKDRGEVYRHQVELLRRFAELDQVKFFAHEYLDAVLRLCLRDGNTAKGWQFAKAARDLARHATSLASARFSSLTALLKRPGTLAGAGDDDFTGALKQAAHNGSEEEAILSVMNILAEGVGEPEAKTGFRELLDLYYRQNEIAGRNGLEMEPYRLESQELDLRQAELRRLTLDYDDEEIDLKLAEFEAAKQANRANIDRVYQKMQHSAVVREGLAETLAILAMEIREPSREELNALMVALLSEKDERICQKLASILQPLLRGREELAGWLFDHLAAMAIGKAAGKSTEGKEKVTPDEAVMARVSMLITLNAMAGEVQAGQAMKMIPELSIHHLQETSHEVQRQLNELLPTLKILPVIRGLLALDGKPVTDSLGREYKITAWRAGRRVEIGVLDKTEDNRPMVRLSLVANLDWQTARLDNINMHWNAEGDADAAMIHDFSEQIMRGISERLPECDLDNADIRIIRPEWISLWQEILNHYVEETRQEKPRNLAEIIKRLPVQRFDRSEAAVVVKAAALLPAAKSNDAGASKIEGPARKSSAGEGEPKEEEKRSEGRVNPFVDVAAMTRRFRDLIARDLEVNNIHGQAAIQDRLDILYNAISVDLFYELLAREYTARGWEADTRERGVPITPSHFPSYRNYFQKPARTVLFGVDRRRDARFPAENIPPFRDTFDFQVLVSDLANAIMDQADAGVVRLLKSIPSPGTYPNGRVGIPQAFPRALLDAALNALVRMVDTDHQNSLWAKLLIPFGRWELAGELAVERSEARDEDWQRVDLPVETVEKLVAIDHLSIPIFRKNAALGIYEVKKLDGISFMDWMRRHPQTSEEELLKQFVAWGIQIADALDSLHRAGIEHGNLDLEHIAIESKTGRAVLAGFGPQVYPDRAFLASYFNRVWDGYARVTKRRPVLDYDEFIGVSLQAIPSVTSFDAGFYAAALKGYYEQHWPRQEQGRLEARTVLQSAVHAIDTNLIFFDFGRLLGPGLGDDMDETLDHVLSSAGVAGDKRTEILRQGLKEIMPPTADPGQTFFQNRLPMLRQPRLFSQSRLISATGYAGDSGDSVLNVTRNYRSYLVPTRLPAHLIARIVRDFVTAREIGRADAPVLPEFFDRITAKINSLNALHKAIISNRTDESSRLVLDHRVVIPEPQTIAELLPYIANAPALRYQLLVPGTKAQVRDLRVRMIRYARKNLGLDLKAVKNFKIRAIPEGKKSQRLVRRAVSAAKSPAVLISGDARFANQFEYMPHFLPVYVSRPGDHNSALVIAAELLKNADAIDQLIMRILNRGAFDSKDLLTHRDWAVELVQDMKSLASMLRAA